MSDYSCQEEYNDAMAEQDMTNAEAEANMAAYEAAAQRADIDGQEKPSELIPLLDLLRDCKKFIRNCSQQYYFNGWKELVDRIDKQI